MPVTGVLMKKAKLYWVFLVKMSMGSGIFFNLLYPGFITAQTRLAGTEMHVSKDNEYVALEGFLWLMTGEYLTGEITFQSHVEDPKLKRAYRVIDRFILNNKFYYNASQVAMYGSTRDKFIRDFTSYSVFGNAKNENDAEENFHPGAIMFNDSVKMAGLVAIRENYVLFTRNPESRIEVCYTFNYGFYKPYKVKHVFQTIKNVTTEYIPGENGFIPVSTENWFPASVLTDGHRMLKGMVQKEGKTFNRFNFRPSGGFVSVFGPSDAFKLTLADAKQSSYYTNGKEFRPADEVLSNLKKTKKDPLLNFNPGVLNFYSGRSFSGKIALAEPAGTGFYFMDAQGEVFPYFDQPDVKMFSIQVNGNDKKFIRIGQAYTAWVFSGKRFSYCQNPYPAENTQKAKSIQFLQEIFLAVPKNSASSLTSASVPEGAETIETGPAEESTPAFKTVLTFDEKEFDPEKKEFIVFVNGAEPVVVNKNNIAGALNVWLLNCKDHAQLNRKIKESMQDLNRISETFQLMNELDCN